MRGRPRLLTDLERLERKRARNRKANMTPSQIERHYQRGNKENLTPEQLEKKNSRYKVANLTPEELERKRADNRLSGMSKDKIKRVREQHRSIMKKKRLDPIFRITGHISRLITFMLKSENSSKVGQSIHKYVPWNKSELKTYLETKFEPWMTWNNYGIYNADTWDDGNSLTWTWQLDHIVPRSDLPYKTMQDDNFKKCWCLENLRPLSAKQNILDGTSRNRHSRKGKS